MSEKKEKERKERSRSKSKSKSPSPKRKQKRPGGPLPKEKKYCGNKDILPDGYDRFGTPYECLKVGFGVALGAQEKKRDEDETREEIKIAARRLNIKITENMSNKEIIKKINKKLRDRIEIEEKKE